MGLEFYIILKGSVSVHIKPPGENVEDKKLIKETPETPREVIENRRYKSNFKGVPKIVSNTKSKVRRFKGNYIVLHNDYLLLRVAKLPAGASFGDIAVIE